MGMSLQVHKPVRRKGKEVGMRANPYARFSFAGEKIAIQDGQFFAEGGKPWVGEIPSWVYDQLEKMDPVVLAELKAPERPGKKSKVDPSVSK